MDFFYNYIFLNAVKILMPIIKSALPKFDEREKNITAVNSVLSSIIKNKKTIWIHAASMGEFEQAKPVIEYIKEKHDVSIICSFFSPSGYNTQKNYKYADAVLYMPIDTKSNAENFINMINPDAAVFVRYELWKNHLTYLKCKKISSVLICAAKPGRSSNYFVNKFVKSSYLLFDKIFTVGELHTKFFSEMTAHKNIETANDTRLDRIAAQAATAKLNPLFDKKLLGDDFILVAGSSWEPDEDIILKAVKRMNSESERKIKVIYTPHEPSKEHIKTLRDKLSSSILLSDLMETNTAVESGTDIVVDSIGKLLKLYGNADIAYIGGAFGAGVHSLTEPAGYGIPLLCGKNCFNSPDADGLLNCGALSTVSNEDDLYFLLKKCLYEQDFYNSAAKASHNYVNNAVGSSKLIGDYIIEMIK